MWTKEEKGKTEYFFYAFITFRLNLAANKCHTSFDKGKCVNLYAHEMIFFDNHLSFPYFNFMPRQQRRKMSGRIMTITFKQDHAIKLKKIFYCVLMCLRANRGECQHAVCHECHKKHSKAQKT